MDKIDELRRIGYFAYTIVDDILWISNKRYNGLYSIDRNTGVTQFHGRFERYPYEKLIIHSYAGQYKNFIFFLPQLGDSIDIYDTNTGKIQSIVLEQWKDADTKTVAGFVQIQSDIYLVPKSVNVPILKFSFESMKVTKYMDIPELEVLKTSEYKILTCNIVSDKNKIWLAVFDYNYIIEVDIENFSCKTYELPNDYKVHSIGFDGKDFWLSKGLSIIRWNPMRGIIEKYDDILMDYTHELNAYSEFVFWKDYVYGVSQWLGKVVRINKLTKEVEILDAMTDKCELVKDGTQNWRHHRNAYILENKLIINPVAYNQEININLDTNEVVGREYLADRKSVYTKKCFFDEKEYDLETFINSHIMSEAIANKTEFNNVGEEIYKIINC